MRPFNIKIFLISFLVMALVACGGAGNSSNSPSSTSSSSSSSSSGITSTQGVGALLWEDNFDTFDEQHWKIDIGDGCDQGLCGWGNQELQWYHQDNVFIDSGFLVLRAQNSNAQATQHNSKVFTSGKIISKDKIAVQYGMIETRVKIPRVEQGLWPAVWMLGTSPNPWPNKGEIDIMEAGHSAQSRSNAGHPSADMNAYVGSNIIFYAEAACVPENPTCAASTAWQTDNAYIAATSIEDRFLTYRLYWTDSELKFTVQEDGVDCTPTGTKARFVNANGGVECELYETPFAITEESKAFQAPFYLLFNLAVGGNFTDAATNDQVSANLPADMLIDYIRVYEFNGQGRIIEGEAPKPIAEEGVFGVLTDERSTDNQLTVGVDADVFVWNTESVVNGSASPLEGDNAIAWLYNSPGQWFGGGVHARGVPNMSAYENGYLVFSMQIPDNIAFRIGMEDAYSNQSWVNFSANENKYGLQRGNWSEVKIPIADIRSPELALQAMKGLFYLASIDGRFPSTTFELAVDDIRWEPAE